MPCSGPRGCVRGFSELSVLSCWWDVAGVQGESTSPRGQTLRSQSGRPTSSRIVPEVTESCPGHDHSHVHLPSLPRLPRAGTMQGPLGRLPGLCCDLSTWETRLHCQTPAPCFISNAGMQGGAPGPRFHICFCSCVTAGTGPGVCPGTSRQACRVRGLGAGAFLLRRNPGNT